MDVVRGVDLAVGNEHRAEPRREHQRGHEQCGQADDRELADAGDALVVDEQHARVPRQGRELGHRHESGDASEEIAQAMTAQAQVGQDQVGGHVHRHALQGRDGDDVEDVHLVAQGPADAQGPDRPDHHADGADEHVAARTQDEGQHHDQDARHQEEHPARILLHQPHDVGVDERGREGARLLLGEAVVGVAFLELGRLAGVRTLEGPVHEGDLAVGTVALAQQVQRPGGDVRGPEHLRLGHVAQLADHLGIVALGLVEDRRAHQRVDLAQVRKTLHLVGFLGHEGPVGQEAAQHRIALDRETLHQRVVQGVHGLHAIGHDDHRLARTALGVEGRRDREVVLGLVGLLLGREHLGLVAKVGEVVLELHAARHEEGQERGDGKAGDRRPLHQVRPVLHPIHAGQHGTIFLGGQLEDAQPGTLVPGFQQEHPRGKAQEGGQQADHDAHGSDHAELVESHKARGQKAQETAGGGEHGHQEREEQHVQGLRHGGLDGAPLGQELLGVSDRIDRIVDAHAEEDRDDEQGVEVQAPVDQTRKPQGQETGEDHLPADQDDRGHLAEEHHDEQDVQTDGDEGRDQAVVLDGLHVLQRIVRTFHADLDRRAILFLAGGDDAVLGVGQHLLDVVHVGGRLLEHGLHDRDPAAVADGAQHAGAQRIGQRVARVDLGLGGCGLLGRRGLLVGLEELAKGIGRLVGKSELLRKGRIEPDPLLAEILVPAIAREQIQGQRSLHAQFELEILEVVHHPLQMLGRNIEQRVVHEELVVAVVLGVDHLVPGKQAVLEVALDAADLDRILGHDRQRVHVAGAETLVGLLERHDGLGVRRQQRLQAGRDLEPLGKQSTQGKQEEGQRDDRALAAVGERDVGMDPGRDLGEIHGSRSSMGCD